MCHTHRMKELVTRARASPLAQGFDGIYMPGEREALLAKKAQACGLEITQIDQNMLHNEMQLAEEFR